MNENKRNSKGTRANGKTSTRSKSANRSKSWKKEDKTSDYIPDSDFSKSDKGFRMRDKSNDVAWYAKNKELLDAAASYSFSNVLGGGTPYSDMKVTPGVLTINYHPVYNSVVQTTAARNIYSYVRHANSGASNYDAPDLMLYINAVDQAFAFIAWVRRIYGLAKVYDQKNRYYPKAIIESMNVDFQDIMDNLSNLWFYIDQITARASVLWIPDSIPVVERHFWMNSNVYMDGDSAKSQTYIMNPTCFYKYNPTLTETGGGLEPIMINGATLLTYRDIMSIGTRLLSVLFEDEDIGIMGGDILKAYGAEHIYTLTPIDASYTVLPTRSDEVLTQIHNAVGSMVPPTNVTQTADGRIQMEAYTIKASEVRTQHYIPTSKTLDFYQGSNPTPEQVMVATRLMAGNYLVTEIGDSVSFIANIMGTEVVENFRMHTIDPATLATTTIGGWTGIVDKAVFGNLNNFIAGYTTFDWAPFIYTGPSDSKGEVSTRIGDVENFTFISNAEIDKLHTTAIFSEYGIPAM